MSRLLALCLGVYLPHLLEEALTRMYDDPIIVAAFGPLSQLPARQAAYLVFQVMLVLALAMLTLASLGGRWRDMVLLGLALALLGESHHVVRWIASHQYNSGLVTALPMPVAGALILRGVFRRAPIAAPLQGAHP
jgi:hypothetical protein